MKNKLPKAGPKTKTPPTVAPPTFKRPARKDESEQYIANKENWDGRVRTPSERLKATVNINQNRWMQPAADSTYNMIRGIIPEEEDGAHNGREDALRHSGTAMFSTSGSWLPFPFNFVKTNLEGLAHEAFGVYQDYTDKDNPTPLNKIPWNEVGMDLRNNLVGSAIGSLPTTNESKKKMLKSALDNNILKTVPLPPDEDWTPPPMQQPKVMPGQSVESPTLKYGGMAMAGKGTKAEVATPYGYTWSPAKDPGASSADKTLVSKDVNNVAVTNVVIPKVKYVSQQEKQAENIKQYDEVTDKIKEADSWRDQRIPSGNLFLPSAEQLAKGTSQIGNKLTLQRMAGEYGNPRTHPIISQALHKADEYMPLHYLGEDASGIGAIPYNIQKGNYKDATLDLALPVAQSAGGAYLNKAFQYVVPGMSTAHKPLMTELKNTVMPFLDPTLPYRTSANILADRTTSDIPALLPWASKFVKGNIAKAILSLRRPAQFHPLADGPNTGPIGSPNSLSVESTRANQLAMIRKNGGKVANNGWKIID